LFYSLTYDPTQPNGTVVGDIVPARPSQYFVVLGYAGTVDSVVGAATDFPGVDFGTNAGHNNIGGALVVMTETQLNAGPGSFGVGTGLSSYGGTGGASTVNTPITVAISNTVTGVGSASITLTVYGFWVTV
jgi:hypothetical protein